MRTLLALFLSILLTACATSAPSTSAPHSIAPDAPGVALAPLNPAPVTALDEAGGEAGDAKSDAKAGGDEAKAESRSFAVGALLYLPNRVVDLFDVAKFGVDVGPGIGIDFQATSALQARAMWNLSVGVGFQGLRHLPFQVGTVAALGVGPIGGVGDVGGWSRSGSGIRLGLHVLIIGAHVEVDPWEILDFVLGFFTIDIADDDF